jgi:ATP-dependent exoDNAse (exonuclease V) beta subunit
MPGLHVPRAGDHKVVWWDPAALELDRDVEGGLRQQKILVADEQATLSFEGRASHDAWKARREAVKARGEVPSLRVVTATELAKDLEVELAPEVVAAARAVTLERTDSPRAGRPGQKRFGLLVHAVLAEIELDRGADQVRAVALAQGRLAAATSEEVDAATAAVSAALEHPLLRRARAAAALGACRREVPVMLPLPGGADANAAPPALMDGTIDLCFREGDGRAARWIVVDFKTDAELDEERIAGYARQVALYCEAVTKATGEPADGVLLSV